MKKINKQYFLLNCRFISYFCSCLNLISIESKHVVLNRYICPSFFDLNHFLMFKNASCKSISSKEFLNQNVDIEKNFILNHVLLIYLYDIYLWLIKNINVV